MYAFLRVETHVGFFSHGLLTWNVLKTKVAFPVSKVMKMEGLFNENPIQKNDEKKVEKGEGRGLSVRGAGSAQHIRGGPPGTRLRRCGRVRGGRSAMGRDVFSRTELRISASRAKKCQQARGDVRFGRSPSNPDKNDV